MGWRYGRGLDSSSPTASHRAAKFDLVKSSPASAARSKTMRVAAVAEGGSPLARRSGRAGKDGWPVSPAMTSSPATIVSDGSSAAAFKSSGKVAPKVLAAPAGQARLPTEIRRQPKESVDLQLIRPLDAGRQ